MYGDTENGIHTLFMYTKLLNIHQNGDIPIFLFPMHYCSTVYSTAVIPTPDIPKIKIEVSHMFGVFMLVIPIPDIYTGF